MGSNNISRCELLGDDLGGTRVAATSCNHVERVPAAESTARDRVGGGQATWSRSQQSKARGCRGEEVVLSLALLVVDIVAIVSCSLLRLVRSVPGKRNCSSAAARGRSRGEPQVVRHVGANRGLELEALNATVSLVKRSLTSVVESNHLPFVGSAINEAVSSELALTLRKRVRADPLPCSVALNALANLVVNSTAFGVGQGRESDGHVVILHGNMLFVDCYAGLRDLVLAALGLILHGEERFTVGVFG